MLANKNGPKKYRVIRAFLGGYSMNNHEKKPIIICRKQFKLSVRDE